MKRITISMWGRYLPLTFAFLTLSPTGAQGNEFITRGNFQSLTTANGLPTNEVRRLYQDKDGYIWIATTGGLCLYDGYQVKTYKSNLYSPHLLSNNNIRCVQEDNERNLWIGTNNGVNILHKPTGKMRQLADPRIRNTVVNVIRTLADGTTFIGTDRELFRYDPRQDSCTVCRVEGNDEWTEQLLNTQDLLEDTNGQLWIAGSYGLTRHDPRTGAYADYGFPSAHVLYEDSRGRIWVGTYGDGLYLLERPYDTSATAKRHFAHKAGDKNSLGDNKIYSLGEDLGTHTLWVGTRSGLSLLTCQDGKTSIDSYQPGTHGSPVTFNEVDAIIRDRQGVMWLGMLGGGVVYLSTDEPMFRWDALPEVKARLSSNAVRSMLMDREGQLWLGIGSYGFIVGRPDSGEWTYDKEMAGFARFPELPTVNAIRQSPSDGRVWLGTFSSGVYIYDGSQPDGTSVSRITNSTHPWLPDHCVYDILEDSLRNHWFATRQGIAVLTPDGNGTNLTPSLLPGFYYCLAQDGRQRLWAGSDSYGALRLDYPTDDPTRVTYCEYSLRNGKLNSDNVQCVYRDSRGNLWMGTDGGGLNLYDRPTDSFIPLSAVLKMPGDGVFSIEEDERGNLWLGSNAGLIKLTVGTRPEESSYRLYTKEFGLQGNSFLRGVSCRAPHGTLYFGGHDGYNSFLPSAVKDNLTPSRAVVSDIRVYNRSWDVLPDKERYAVSAQAPPYATHITLRHDQNNFSIEFGALNYMAPDQCLYAYRLEGFDKEWNYTGASRRFAYYNNLDAGTYEFRLKAANERGVWEERPLTVKVVVLPAPWATWWAYLIYMAILLALAYYTYRVVRNRLRLKNLLRYKEMERSKQEELNHTKLQFFTNITHELLTPLTIISATIDELKTKAPGFGELYTGLDYNVARLIRLLQQILEFRKAETGNLKLRVSHGDVTAFVRGEAESFLPLTKKKKLHFSVLCEPESITGWFDPDKLDKILYNLLSNAAKYNSEGGFVQVNLSYDGTDRERVLLQVRDNGKGMSPEEMKNLFHRFYEGEHRRFNTIGTGIGLSLTKNLVELHGGTIRVESEVDKGTTFFVLLPIDKSYFKEEEIDEQASATPLAIATATEAPAEPATAPEGKKDYTLLVLEDNAELLELMVRLLGREYNVLTGQNGKEGVEILENEEVSLIVTDVMMPEMDGIALCRYVKSHLDHSHIPVLLLTAKNAEKDRAEAYEAGADAFIAKPFSLQVLHARIENLLKTRERVIKDFKKQLVFEAKELNYTSIDEEFLQRAIDCVHRHLDDPNFDQGQLLEELHTTKSTFFRKLKSLTGLTYTSFIRNIRMKAACRIMEEKRHVRISELAYAVGFNDPRYFSSSFKKEIGMQPSEYIERFLEDGTLEEETNVSNHA
ncbi:MAG: response regulator [Mediterranea sp.]|jgi:signal transduction histidine kinase/ligand-binding sensor domain-containing protein/AraC-like DNA-binding protein|nr:response regulator [Mediterranea sp.]